MRNVLVSVIVVTYNSDKYILDTLESIKSQEYSDIELIITDDCSSDNTVAICKDWLSKEENNNRFVRCELLDNQNNIGISGNCNNGLRVSTGKWIKLIAGDDVLLPECINSFISFAQSNPVAKVIVSKLKWFSNDLKDDLGVWPIVPLPIQIETQLKQQLKGGFVKAPAVFINRFELLSQGGFDESYPFLEDDPLWVKFLVNGSPFYFLPKVLVGYRLHSDAISNGSGEWYINEKFFSSLKAFKEEIVFPLMLKNKMYLWFLLAKKEIQIVNDIILNGNNPKRVSFYNRLMLYLISSFRKINNQ